MSKGTDTIKIAIIGVGNCASSLLQGIHYYRDLDVEPIGLMHEDISGYKISDIKIVAAYDVDQRKVGLDLSNAIFQLPNCTQRFYTDIPASGTIVQMGKVLDGIASHMLNEPEHRTFIRANEPEPDIQDVVEHLHRTGAEMILNYLPVGSQKATEFYAECALRAGIGFINNIPVFIASDEKWIKKFEDANLPLIGDDVKSQLGATILHRTIVNLCKLRGVKVDRTYQLNTGGNTDFLNMLNRDRLKFKKVSKTEAVQAVCKNRLDDENIHVGPSDYVPWQNDNKIAFIRLEGRLFGNIPMNLEMRLSVEDSPNSAGIVIDAIRCMKLALNHRIGGVLKGPSAYFCKHPYTQYSDQAAFELTEQFINSPATHLHEQHNKEKINEDF